MPTIYDEDVIVPNMEDYEYDRECYRINYREWLKWKFYWQVMTYLNNHRPNELMREDFRVNCEAIYEKDRAEYEAFNISFDDLFWNKSDMQSILEKWNDCFMLEDEEDNN